MCLLVLSQMEIETFKKLKTLIEALTHSGSSTLDEDIFNQVKKICKSSQANIPQVYNLVLAQLKKNNSQVRFSAFQICEELFKRSVVFRENILKDLHLILELTTGINTSQKLPPPKSTAESLKTLALATLKKWVEEYGETYKKLKFAYNYFKKCKEANFETFQIHNSAEQIVENEQQRHIRTINEKKIKKVLDEFKSIESDIEVTITSLSNCLSLLLPPAEEFFIPEYDLQKTSFQNDTKSFNDSFINSNEPSSSNTNKENSTEGCDYLLENSNNLREFGVPLDFKLTLHINLGGKFKVAKTDENSSVIENAKDCVRLINNRYLPMVKKFIRIYCKSSTGSMNEIKKIIDLKEKLENILKKYNSVVIDEGSDVLNNESSSDDEFEEFTKEGYEEFVDFSEDKKLECLQKKTDFMTSNPAPDTSQSISEETSASNSSAISNEASSCSGVGQLDRKKKLLAIAPKLPYDIDLYHWEDEQLSTPTLISTRIDVDKFWGSAGADDIHEIPNPEGIAALRTRVIEYTGTFEPVKWACRAPLPNGKLCPRRDRYKCPFHGKIVARNIIGNIQNEDDEKTSSHTAEKSSANIPDFQDSEFLSDLQAATGVDLKMLDRKGKKRKFEQKNLTHKELKTSTAALKIMEAKKLPGLYDVVKRQNNAYTRLSKKIFNRSSLRRVSSVLNKLDRKKFLDKYGDQFNYV